MPVDSPEDIDRDEGIDNGGSSTFYRFILICVIIGALLALVSYHYGVPASQPAVVPVPAAP